MVDGVFNGRHFSPSGRSAAASLCSPLPTSPCGSVSRSKIFTFPPPNFSLSSGRRPPLFAPRSPLTLMPPSLGAKSSHYHRRFSPFHAAAGLPSLLPTLREPLWLRLGEQNLHIPAAGFRPLRRPAASSLCSPLPASPCGSVSGSKIFTFPPPDFALSGDRRPPLFAPHSPRALVAPFRGAKSSHSRRRFPPSPTAGVPQQQKTSGPRLIRSPGCSAATHFSILHFQRPKVEPP